MSLRRSGRLRWRIRNCGSRKNPEFQSDLELEVELVMHDHEKGNEAGGQQNSGRFAMSSNRKPATNETPRTSLLGRSLAWPRHVLNLIYSMSPPNSDENRAR
jgi:hypothetical protein